MYCTVGLHHLHRLGLLRNNLLIFLHEVSAGLHRVPSGFPRVSKADHRLRIECICNVHHGTGLVHRGIHRPISNTIHRPSRHVDAHDREGEAVGLGTRDLSYLSRPVRVFVRARVCFVYFDSIRCAASANVHTEDIAIDARAVRVDTHERQSDGIGTYECVNVCVA